MANVNTVCKNLNRTYNTNVVDTGNIMTQAAFYKTTTEYGKVNKGNDVLLDLLHNHYDNKMPVAQYVSGPRTLTVHTKDGSDKIFYIFGEFHGIQDNCSVYDPKSCPEYQIRNPKSGKCVSSRGVLGQKLIAEGSEVDEEKDVYLIHDYLWDLLQTTDVFIDFFIEISAFTGEKYSRDIIDRVTHLNWVRMRFKDCAQTAYRTDDKCKLGRTHYIDIRYIDFLTIEEDIIYIKSKFRHAKRSNINDILSDKKIQNILGKLQGSYNEVLQYVKDSFKMNKHVQKEISRSYMGQEIQKFIDREIDKMVSVDKWRHIKYYISKLLLDSASSDAIVEIAGKLGLIILNIAIIMVDVYTLSRVFKKFNVKNVNQPEEPTNIIIYAGNHHSKRYRKFLKNNGYNEILSSGLEHTFHRRCLDLRDIPQPFFRPQLSKKTLPQDKWAIYTKTGCSFCDKAKELLNNLYIPYTAIEVNDENRESIYNEIDHQTGSYRYFPIIFQNGRFIGGYNELSKRFQALD